MFLNCNKLKVTSTKVLSVLLKANNYATDMLEGTPYANIIEDLIDE